MENYLGEIGNLIFTLALLTGISYLAYSSWKKKKLKINQFAKELNARQIDSGIIGQYKSFEYILHMDEGHSGGAASGPTGVGYPSSIRLIIEKNGTSKFHLKSKSSVESPHDSKIQIKIQEAAQTLFAFGFKEIEYDGNTLDIKLYPYNLDSPVTANGIKSILPAVSQIVEVI